MTGPSHIAALKVLSEDMRVFPRYEGEPPRIADLTRRGFRVQEAIGIAARWDQMTEAERQRALPALGPLIERREG